MSIEITSLCIRSFAENREWKGHEEVACIDVDSVFILEKVSVLRNIEFHWNTQPFHDYCVANESYNGRKYPPLDEAQVHYYRSPTFDYSAVKPSSIHIFPFVK